jgi:glycine/serine hydroxymethyltransferase
MGESEMDEIADMINNVIRNMDSSSILDATKHRVQALCERFAVYQP